MSVSTHGYLGEDTKIDITNWVNTNNENIMSLRFDYDITLMGSPAKMEQIALALLSKIQQIQEKEIQNA